MYQAITDVIGNADLPHSETVYRFEGHRNGDNTNVSFVLLDTPGTTDR